MSDPLQKKAFWATVWSVCGGFMNEIVRFVIGVILARLLMPEDYGMVGMLGIFIAISTCIVDGGMSNALVRKTDYTNADLSTVFYYNTAVAVLLYAVLFVAAPYIAAFYGYPIWCDLIRVLCTVIVLGVIEGILKIKLFIDLDFKRINLVKITGALVGGIVGIACAYQGLGVWSLVFMQLAGGIWRSLHMWVLVRWRPDWEFSYASFKEFFSFGVKLLMANLINTAYNNIYQMVIGKFYSSASLGYYTRASQYAELPAMTLTWGIGNVSYPLLCRFQNDVNELVRVYRKSIRLTCFIVFPALMGIAAVANPLIVVLITEKWLPCVYLLQILCFAFIWYPINTLNTNILQVVGRSDLYLRSEIIKKIVGILIFISTVPFGVEYICFGIVLVSILGVIINCFYTKQIINIGLKEMIKESYSSFSLSLIMFLLVFGVLKVADLSPCMSLMTGIIIGASFYCVLSIIFRVQPYKETLDILGENLKSIKVPK